MEAVEIMQATTPTLMLSLPIAIELDEVNLYFSMEQGSIKIEKTGDDIEIGDEDQYIYIPLSQRETMKFAPGSAKIQLNVTKENGKIRIGTYEAEVKILRNQIKRVLP